ncbi:MAG: hypothetical protein V3S25_08305 [Nitrospirales bacterium]
MERYRGSLLTLAALLLLIGVVACTEGPAERAGKQIDQAIEDTAAAIADKVGDTADATADETGDIIEEGAEAFVRAGRVVLEKAKEIGETIEEVAKDRAEHMKDAIQ